MKRFSTPEGHGRPSRTSAGGGAPFFLFFFSFVLYSILVWNTAPVGAQSGVYIANLKVAGESIFQPLFTQLATTYLYAKDDVSLAFQPQTTTEVGLSLYTKGSVDGAFSAVPANSSSTWPGMVYIPIAGIPLIPIYRLPASVAQPTTAPALILDCPTLGAIWAGDITYWRDPRLVNLNTASWSTLLPDANITLILDQTATSPGGDSQMGITGAFQRALAACSSEFNAAWQAAGHSWSSLPPVVGGWAHTASNRVQGVSQYTAGVGVLSYGTYFEVTSALSSAGVKMASMKPNANATTAASSALTGTQTAIGTQLTQFANGMLLSEGTASGVVTSNVTGDWPMASMLLAVIAGNSSGRGLPVGTSTVGDCSYPRELLRMLAWIHINEGADAMLTGQGLAPLPKTFRSHATDLVGTVDCGGIRILDQAFVIAMGEPLVSVYQRMVDSYSSGSLKMKFYSGNTNLVYATMPTGQIDFGAVSNAVPANIQAAVPDMEPVPMLAGALAPIYNVPDLVGLPALIVDFSTITGIFIGEIKMWNDDRLKAINPAISDKLPNVPIKIAYQNYASAVTYHYTKLLALANSTWAKVVGPPTQTIDFPVMHSEPNRTVPVPGTTVPLYVSAANYSFAFWPRHSLEGVNNVLVAGIYNSAGNVVYANTDSIESTLADFADKPLDPAFQMILGPGANSWPVCFFNCWIIRNRTMPDCTKASALLDFMYWVQTSSTAETVADFSYIVRVAHAQGSMARVLRTIKGFTCKGQTVSALAACITDDGQMCSGNGQCVNSQCVCSSPWSGTLCEINSASSDSTSAATIALSVALPVAFLLVLLTIVVALILVAFFRLRQRPENWEVDLSEVEMDRMLGQGAYGEVYKATWKGTEVAVKVISGKNHSKENERNFKDEVKVMTTLRHPNVVLFMGACTKPPNMAIIMEYMALGSLYDLLHNELIPDIPFMLVVKIGYQAAKGMHFLHSSGIVHRDLKSLNLLLDNKWNVKVSDFGLTKFKEETKKSGGGDGGGTLHWTAPEVLCDEPGLDYILADVYSFGIIMWELLTRDQPYVGLSPAAVAVAVIRDDLRPGIPKDLDVPPEYQELMSACWHRDPTIRPTFLEVMTRLSAMSGDSSALTGTSGNSSSSSSMHKAGSNDGSWTLPSNSSTSQSGSRSGGAVGGAGPRAPSGEMAIVFTDIVRAASLWEFNAAAMRDATLAHNQLLRSTLSLHNGYEAIFQKDRNTGEGSFCMAFSHAADAVEWCMAVQKGLLDLSWPEELLTHPGATEEWGDTDDRILYRGLRVRMGIHWGTPKCIKDPITRKVEYVGPVVSAAARITSMAHGGQILLSQGAWAKIKGSSLAAEKNRVMSLGQFQLPDSSRGEKLYEVKARGLEGRFFGGVTKDSDPSGTSTTSGDEETLQTAVGEGIKHEEDRYLTSANLCRWVIDYNEIQMGDQIGMGSYGVVFKGKWKGVEVAVKRFIKQKLDERRMLEFRAEMAFLSEMHHPNIVLFIGACLNRPNLCIVTEYAKQGSLKDILGKTAIKLPWSQKLQLLHSAALGINYLHSLKPVIVHRDLKPSNLLVDESWNVKVGDFGFARIKEENATMTRCGSPSWTAPEIIRGENYSESADVYSFGIIMWEVLTRKQPYAGHNFMGVSLEVLEGRRPQIPADCPDSYRKLMKKCWHAKADKRPHIGEVVEALASWIGAPSTPAP